jgi:hypothetical protein
MATHKEPEHAQAQKPVQKPLPKPGDADYVVGQPVDEEERRRTEAAEAERLKGGKKEDGAIV